MKNAEQGMEFIDDALNKLEKSVLQKKDTEIFQAKQEFNTLISEYRKVIGTKSVNAYTQNYAKIVNMEIQK